MSYYFRTIFILLSLVFVISVKAQQSNTTLALLDSLQRTVPELSATISLSVGDAGIQDFLRGVASSSGLNLSVDPALNFRVSNSFTNVKVADLLVYLSQQYNLNIQAIGNIFTISAREVPMPVQIFRPGVIYDNDNNKLSLDYSNVELGVVAREITKATGRNLVLLPGSEQMRVSGFVQQMPFDNALQKFGLANNLIVKRTPDDFYMFESMIAVLEPQQNNNQQQQRRRIIFSETPINIEALNIDSISIDVNNVALADIVSSILKKLSLDYYFLDQLDGTVTMKLSKVPLDRLLDYIFRSTEFTYKKQGRSYWFGSVKNAELRETRIVRLENRTVEKIKEYIPESMLTGITVKEFIDQNSILLTGSRPKLAELEFFLNQLDKKVPVVMIEVMMVEVNNSTNLTAGVKAHLGDGKTTTTTSGDVFPSTNMTLNSQSINDLLGRFNGFSSLNIGKVTPNFYVTLAAMESNGIVDVHSTPKLSTLNGHEATLTIGSTEYYKEQQSSYYGTLTTQLNTQYSYKSVNADLSVKITPYVSGNEQITLDIEVKQTDFSGTKLDTNAPPNSISRNFKSQIRVKNEDMILLGGLEQKKISDTGEGIPFLSRIPVIKWFFSYRVKTTSKSKLNLFIRPTIIY